MTSTQVQRDKERIIAAAKRLSEAELLSVVVNPNDKQLCETFCAIEDAFSGYQYAKEAALQVVRLCVQGAQANLVGQSHMTLSEHADKAINNVIESLQQKLEALFPEKSSTEHYKSGGYLREELEFEIGSIKQYANTKVATWSDRSFYENLALIFVLHKDRNFYNLGDALDSIMAEVDQSVEVKNGFSFFNKGHNKITLNDDEFARYSQLSAILGDFVSGLQVSEGPYQLPEKTFTWIHEIPQFISAQEKIADIERAQLIAPEIPVVLIKEFQRSLKHLCDTAEIDYEKINIPVVFQSLVTANKKQQLYNQELKGISTNENTDLDELVALETKALAAGNQVKILETLGQTDGSLAELIADVAIDKAQESISGNAFVIATQSITDNATAESFQRDLRDLIVISILDNSMSRVLASKMIRNPSGQHLDSNQISKIKSDSAELKRLQNHPNSDVKHAFIEFISVIDQILDQS